MAANVDRTLEVRPRRHAACSTHPSSVERAGRGGALARRCHLLPGCRPARKTRRHHARGAPAAVICAPEARVAPLSRSRLVRGRRPAEVALACRAMPRRAAGAALQAAVPALRACAASGGGAKERRHTLCEQRAGRNRPSPPEPSAHHPKLSYSILYVAQPPTRYRTGNGGAGRQGRRGRRWAAPGAAGRRGPNGTGCQQQGGAGRQG